MKHRWSLRKRLNWIGLVWIGLTGMGCGPAQPVEVPPSTSSTPPPLESPIPIQKSEDGHPPHESISEETPSSESKTHADQQSTSKDQSPSQNSPQKNSVEKSIAETLGIRTIPASSKSIDGQQIKCPDPSVSFENSPNPGKGWNKQVKFQENQLSYLQLIPVSPQKELFFVWPADSLESSIFSAEYLHRILDSNNHWIENLGPKSALYDPSQKRWYIAISDLFKNTPRYQAKGIFRADTQVLTLNLTLTDGKKISIEIRFRAYTTN